MKINAVFLAATVAVVDVGAAQDEVPTPTAYCNSIGCPNTYVPIADAHTVECVGGECKVEQCCSLFCSSFGCAAGTNPIPYADTTSCENGVCTQEMCCDADQPQAQHGSCMSYACPAGFAIIGNAADKDCKHDPNDETIPPEPAPGPGSDGDDGLYSYGYDDESSSSKDFFDENFPYDLSYELSDDYEWDSGDVASSGDGRRMLRSSVGRGAGSPYKFVSWWGTSSSVEEALCSVETCCREV